jgi:hypothetical protein
MSKTLEQLEDERFAWSLETFKRATSISSLRKLEGKINEIKTDIINGQDPGEGYAEALMCLLDSAARRGITFDQLTQAFARKLEKNKARTWTVNPDNTYSHIESGG